MELHQLRYFLAVADEGTFTAAARVLRISQSGVSTQLQKLERELGVRLVERSSRRVALTPAGEELLPRARDAVAAVAAVASAADGLRGVVTGPLRVGTVVGVTWTPLFDALAAVHSQHPRVELQLHDGASTSLLDEVVRGHTDVAVVAWVGDLPGGVHGDVVVEDDLVVLVAADHPWATRQVVERADLRAADLVSLPPGTGARTALDVLVGGASPRWEVTSPDHVRALVSRGMGFGVVSATTATRWDDVVRLPIAGGDVRSRFGVVRRPRPSPAARALLEHLGLAPAPLAPPPAVVG